jgi:hypothetical protein
MSRRGLPSVGSVSRGLPFNGADCHRSRVGETGSRASRRGRHAEAVAFPPDRDMRSPALRLDEWDGWTSPAGGGSGLSPIPAAPSAAAPRKSLCPATQG